MMIYDWRLLYVFSSRWVSTRSCQTLTYHCRSSSTLSPAAPWHPPRPSARESARPRRECWTAARSSLWSASCPAPCTGCCTCRCCSGRPCHTRPGRSPSVGWLRALGAMLMKPRFMVIFKVVIEMTMFIHSVYIQDTSLLCSNIYTCTCKHI